MGEWGFTPRSVAAPRGVAQLSPNWPPGISCIVCFWAHEAGERRQTSRLCDRALGRRKGPPLAPTLLIANGGSRGWRAAWGLLAAVDWSCGTSIRGLLHCKSFLTIVSFSGICKLLPCPRANPIVYVYLCTVIQYKNSEIQSKKMVHSGDMFKYTRRSNSRFSNIVHSSQQKSKYTRIVHTFPQKSQQKFRIARSF